MTSQPEIPATPELDRQSEIIHSGRSETVQEFIDWLREEKKYLLAEWRDTTVESCMGVRRYSDNPSNCEGGRVIKTVTGITYPFGMDVHSYDVCPVCEGTGEVTVTHRNPFLVQVWVRPEELMADFFGIDLKKIESERRALLDALRAAAT